MKSDLFQAPASVTKLETMSDGGIRIVVDTQEITDPAELAKLFSLRKGSIGHFLFKENTILAEDIPEEDAMVVEGETKTPSKRLRSVLFVYWKDVKGGKGQFDSFYRETMEKLIDMYKEKLPPKSED